MSRIFAVPRPAAAKVKTRPVLAAPMTAVRATPRGTEVAAPAEAEIRGLVGGRPLSAAERGFHEPRLGAALGDVRVHTGRRAEMLAAGVGARAFAYGRNVVLGRGEYSAGTAHGRRLMAHELVHAIQRPGPDRLQRIPLGKELDKELAAWAKATGKSIDPSNRDYAFNLQDYAYKLIWHASSSGPLPRPRGRRARKRWKRKFKKAGLLASKILAAGKVDQKEDRAAMILALMARAGFATEAVGGAAKISSAAEAEQVYEAVLKNVKKVPPATLKLVTEFFIKRKGLTGNPIVDKLTDKNGTFEKSLKNSQLKAVLAPLIATYEKNPILMKVLPEVLVHKKGFRRVFSAWMWKAGKGDLLFKVLGSKFFVEPGYGPSVFAGVGELKLGKDMPWVYANKQRYYVGYLVKIGTEAGVAIKKPRNLRFKTLRKWLDDNTEKFGAALAKKYPNDPARWTRVYQQLADIFFFHVDRGDVKPDLKGKLGKLGAAAPRKMRLKSDCDVLAIYAMRYFFSIKDPASKTHKGFEPVGYLVIDPKGRDGHAVALMRRSGLYYVISNKEVFKTAVTESSANGKKSDALKAAKKQALKEYNAPKPTKLKIYYADSGAGGAMPRALAKTAPSTRRTDLE